MMMMKKSQFAFRRALYCGAALTFAATAVQPALAQSETPAVATTSLDEILVTAQRREESISRVPVSVVAFDDQVLQTRVIVSEQDLGSLVPGLLVKNGQNSNQLSFSMRGQTLDPFSGTSPAVLTYLNEAPFTGGNTATAFFDFANIQVLKGPQGTLFGRNATGGAVLYATPMPGDEIKGYATARVAERNMYQLQGAIDLPIVPGKLSMRLAGDLLKGDGYIRNINTGNTLGDKDTKSGRVTLVYTPTDTIKNTTLFQHSDIGGTEGTGGLYSYYTLGQNFNGKPLTTTLDIIYGPAQLVGWNGDGPAGPGRWPGGPAGYLAFQLANPFKTWLQYDLPHKAHATFLSNTTEVEVGDNLLVKNIFSLTDTFARTPGNLAGSPFGALWLFNFPGSTGLGNGPPGGETFDIRRYTNELQLQGSTANGRLDYIAGFFYAKSRQTDYIPIAVGADLPVPLADIAYHYTARNDSTAVFGQLTYKLTDQLTAAVGGRYSWEKVSLEQRVGAIFFGAPKQEKKLDAPSWTINLQYQINPDNMVYVAQRGSFRSGNLNGTVVPFGDLNFFKNEKTHDFEIGYKFNGALGDMPTRFSIAAYQQIVKNAQHAIYALIGGNPAGFTVNVPKKKVKGIEVDGSVSVTDSLQLGFTLAHTDGEFTDNIVPLAQLTGTPNDSITFDSYPDTPKWAGSAFADLRLPLPETVGEVRLRGDVFKQTSTFFSNNGNSITPGTKLDGYTTVNFRLSWNEIMKSKVSAGVYVKNAFDKLHYVSGFVMGGAGGYNTAYPGEPRTIGGEISVKF
jgi:iron complex outermembrane recepter protein